MNSMITSPITCPVCQTLTAQSHGNALELVVECDFCGAFTMDPELAVQVRSGDSRSGHWALNEVHRAALAHRIRTFKIHTVTHEHSPYVITRETLDSIRANGELPSVAVQAQNAIRYIGDEVSRTGMPVKALPRDFCSIIGSFDQQSAVRLVEELFERNIVRIGGHGSAVQRGDTIGSPFHSFASIDLSLDGWKQYEAEKHGMFKGDYGFIAMKFDDSVLDDLVNNYIKPKIKEDIGYKLIDLRDVSRAGIIDNIMRTQIRNSKFVIVDLSHDNSGAYWEAGYAEGLSKPVIYICERTKFDEAKTHFDTNHCTTVLWSMDGCEEFLEALIATIWRSIEKY